MYTEADLRRALAEEAAAVTLAPDAVVPALRARRARRQRRQAVAATLSVLAVAGSVLGIVIASRPGQSGPQVRATTSYPQICAHEPDVCKPGTSGSVPSAVFRPLDLPTVAAGARCPVTQGRDRAGPYVGGVEFGAGPVRMVVADRSQPVHGVVALGYPQANSKVLAATNALVIAPSYRGPVLLRGERLDGPGTVLFDGHVAAYVDPPADANTQQDGTRTPPASIFVRSPGCYGFQLDGTDFTETIVLQLVAPRATSGTGAQSTR